MASIPTYPIRPPGGFATRYERDLFNIVRANYLAWLKELGIGPSIADMIAMYSPEELLRISDNIDLIKYAIRTLLSRCTINTPIEYILWLVLEGMRRVEEPKHASLWKQFDGFTLNLEKGEGNERYEQYLKFFKSTNGKAAVESCIGTMLVEKDTANAWPIFMGILSNTARLFDTAKSAEVNRNLLTFIMTALLIFKGVKTADYDAIALGMANYPVKGVDLRGTGCLVNLPTYFNRLTKAFDESPVPR